jgi:SAM-dependent methyltransferase
VKLNSTFVGTIDVFEDNMISGWALDRQNLADSVGVDLYVDGRRVATFTADLPRPDLAAISPVSPRKGFRFDVTPFVQDHLMPQIEVLFGDTHDRIPPSPRAARYVNRPTINLLGLYSLGFSPWTPSPPPEIIRYITGVSASPEQHRRDYLTSGMINAADIYNVVLDLGLDSVQARLQIVDLGCGAGRYATFLKQYMPACEYVGYDVWEDAISWAQNSIGPAYRDVRFELLERKGGYASSEAYDLPNRTASVDLLIAMSLFTHLNIDPCLRYLHEVRRTLSYDGVALVTFCILDQLSTPKVESIIEGSTLPLTRTLEAWWLVNDRYVDMFFTERLIRRMAADAGLEVFAIRRGNWYQPSADINPAAYEDMVMLRRARPRDA